MWFMVHFRAKGRPVRAGMADREASRRRAFAASKARKACATLMPAPPAQLLAQRVDLDVAALPYDEAIVGLVKAARAAGRPVYIASASNEKFVAPVAAHVGLFDGWFASYARTNVSAGNKAARLVGAIAALPRIASMALPRRASPPFCRACATASPRPAFASSQSSPASCAPR
jgi:phosphoserine phosphatase